MNINKEEIELGEAISTIKAQTKKNLVVDTNMLVDDSGNNININNIKEIYCVDNGVKDLQIEFEMVNNTKIIFSFK